MFPLCKGCAQKLKCTGSFVFLTHSNSAISSLPQPAEHSMKAHALKSMDFLRNVYIPLFLILLLVEMKNVINMRN